MIPHEKALAVAQEQLARDELDAALEAIIATAQKELQLLRDGNRETDMALIQLKHEYELVTERALVGSVRAQGRPPITGAESDPIIM